MGLKNSKNGWVTNNGRGAVNKWRVLTHLQTMHGFYSTLSLRVIPGIKFNITQQSTITHQNVNENPILANHFATCVKIDWLSFIFIKEVFLFL